MCGRSRKVDLAVFHTAELRCGGPPPGERG
jgi:hypothetical protein